MPSPDSVDVLNRVMVLLVRSFPQYVRYARPYIPPGRETVMQTIDQIVAGQEALAERLSQFIFESGGLPDHGKFPIEFTDTHDLAIDFLIQEAIGYQKEDIANLEECIEWLRFSPAAQSLAAEALGMAKGHRESLEELAMVGNDGLTKFGGAKAFANDPPVAADLAGAPHRQEERKLVAGDPHSPG
jgi:bacterioferritin (cytochrome b1)